MMAFQWANPSDELTVPEAGGPGIQVAVQAIVSRLKGEPVARDAVPLTVTVAPFLLDAMICTLPPGAEAMGDVISRCGAGVSMSMLLSLVAESVKSTGKWLTTA